MWFIIFSLFYAEAGPVTRALNVSVLLLLSIVSTSHSKLALIPILQSKFHKFGVCTFWTFTAFESWEDAGKNVKNWNHTANSLIHLLTHHMLKQLQTCRPSHPTFLNQDIEQFLQLIQRHLDPAIKVSDHDYHSIWQITVIWNTKAKRKNNFYVTIKKSQLREKERQHCQFVYDIRPRGIYAQKFSISKIVKILIA